LELFKCLFINIKYSFSLLMQQLWALRNGKHFCDCTVLVGDSPHRAHKLVLAASSMLFRSLLAISDTISIDTAVVSSQEFSCLLNMVYTGKLPLGKHNVSRIIAAADNLQMFDVAIGFKKVLSTIVNPQPSLPDGTDQSSSQDEMKMDCSDSSTTPKDLPNYELPSETKSPSEKLLLIKKNKEEDQKDPGQRVVSGQTFITTEVRVNKHGMNVMPHICSPLTFINEILVSAMVRPHLPACSHFIPGMIYHMRSEHFEEKPFSCKECGTKFAAKSSLKNHMRLHTGEKPYSCKECEMSFAVAAGLAYHIKKKHAQGKHTCTSLFEVLEAKISSNPEPMYACQYCKAAFAQSIELTRHVRTHTGDRPYVCRECGKGYCQAKGLTDHLQTAHTEAKPVTREEAEQMREAECLQEAEATTAADLVRSQGQSHLESAEQVFVALADGQGSSVVEVSMFDLLNNSVTFICEEGRPGTSTQT
uniref:Zinc finger and BTB domain containing 40 n=1 Tax=Periophthalmus magnuspinnatus TaxID=409849 RepID=A0A3B4B7U5_9GOBI